MTPNEILAYFGPALVYAAIGAALLWPLWRAAAGVDGRHALTLFLALFFLVLTQHPLPDRATLDCGDGGVRPILRPFATLDHVGRMWLRQLNDPSIGPTRWLGSKVIQAAVMNFTLFALIGAAFARHAGGRRPFLAALAFGVLLSGAAELMQLTGLFGLYPCAWRTFETDDLILNTAGLIAGFAVMRKWMLRRDGP
jgi:hypothetical protein